MILQLSLLCLSLVILMYASEKTVTYTLRVAHYYEITTLFAGFIILSAATGLPELLVGLYATFLGNPELSVGDIMGSNLVDSTLAIGLPIILYGTLPIAKINYIQQRTLMIIICSALASVFFVGSVSKIMGTLLILLYIVTNYIFYITQKGQSIARVGAYPQTPYRSIIKLCISLLAILIFTPLSVHSAVALAQAAHIPLAAFGATFFAIGTSLPELLLNLQAIRQKAYPLVIGNTLGSIFNQGILILGTLGLISPYPLSLHTISYIVPFLGSALFIIAYHLWTTHPIKRLTAIILVAIYVLFVMYEWYVLKLFH